jgi:hypothetical protein
MRQDIIDAIQQAYDAEPNEWKDAYYKLAVRYLNDNKILEGGNLCAYCREQGLSEPHHHNVWPSMIASLVKLGWIEKIGEVVPTTRQTHINKVGQWRSRLYQAAKL